MPDTNMPAVIDGGAFLSFVERAMRDDTFDVSKFQSLLTEYRMERDRLKRDAFNRDMADVQNEIGRINATGRNPTFNKPYAALEDLDRAARPVYTQHGFSVRYGSALSDKTVPPPAPGELRAVLIVSHREGYSEEHYLDGPKDIQTGARGRTGIQAVGSTVTYLRRYLLQMVLNLVPAQNPDDDDGEATRPAPRGSTERWEPTGAPMREASAKSEPAPRPPSQPKQQRRTWADWLDELEAELGGCEAEDEVNEIVGREQTQKATETLRNGAADRLNKMIRDTYDRVVTNNAPPLDDDIPL